jgi:hypothetical protein
MAHTTKEYQRAWRTKHQELVRQYSAKYRARHRNELNIRQKNKAKMRRETLAGRARRILAQVKYRATRTKVPYSLTAEWVIQKFEQGHCEVTGLPFILEGNGSGPNRPFMPSLDQKVPGLGYTTENTQIVVWIYNAAKGCWSHDAVMRLAEALTHKS